MRKIAFLIFGLILAARVMAQAAPANYTVALNKFKAFYNGNKPDSVFDMFSPEMKAVLPLDKFTTTTQQLAAELGKLNKTDLVKYNAPLALYRATFQNGVFMLNLALNDQNQLTGLRLTPNEDNTKALPVDDAVTESPVSLKTFTGSISGTLTIPKDASGKMPVVVIVAGNGPTDRDGNNPKADISGNTYKLLAYALGKAGIASVRYDKRMVGQSITSQKEKELNFQDYVDDATSIIGMLGDDARFSKIIIAGHGDGALAAMLATQEQPVAGCISFEGAADPAEKIMANQLKSKPSFLGDEFKAMLDSLRKGKFTDNIDPSLYYMARPSIQPYLMSWCRYVPTTVIHSVKVPLLIIQGTTDLQVSADNGQRLKNAKSAAKYAVIRGMNFILKDAPPDADKNLATYKDPTLPLNTEMVGDVVDFIKGL